MSGLPRLLYVDDSTHDRELVRYALSREEPGFLLTEAGSREEFEQEFAHAEFDLILSDFHILGYEGFEVFNAVRAARPHLPVVFVTGTGSEEMAVEAMRRGAADYVIKTAEHIRRLPLTIRAVLDRQEKLAAARLAEEHLKTVSRVRHVRGQCNRALVRAVDEDQLLSDLCRLVVEVGDFAGAWISLAPSAPPDDAAPRPPGRIAALAARHEPSQTVRNLAGEAERKAWSAAAIARGERSVTALPLLCEAQSLGALAIVAREPEGLRDGEFALLEELADDIAYGIHNLRARAVHRRTEQALHDAERLARATIDALPEHICVLDHTGRILAVNRAGASLLNASVGDPAGLLEGANYFALNERAPGWASVDKGAVARGTRAVLDGQIEGFRHEYALAGDGPPRWYQVNVTPFPREGPRRAVMAHENITPRKLAEAALRESEARYRAISELSADYFWDIDESYRVKGVFAGSHAPRVPEYATALGALVWTLPCFRHDTEHQSAAHRAVLGARAPFRDVLVWDLETGAHPICYSISGHPVFDDAGDFKGYRGIAREVTAIKRAEQLQALEHRITRCLAEEQDASRALGAAIQAICETEHWECGRFFRVDEDSEVLRMEHSWCGKNAQCAGYLSASQSMRYRPGVGLAGRAWQTGKPLWSKDVQKDPRTSQLAPAEAAGMHGAFVLPIAAGDKVVAVLLFSTTRLLDPDEGLLQALCVAASQIGQFLQKRTAESVLRRFRTAMDLTSDCVVLVDRQRMRYVDVNEGACRMLGYTRAEMLMMGPQAVVPGAQADLESRYDSVIAGGTEVVMTTYIRRDGSLVPVEVARGAVQVEGRWLIAASARDITSRIAAAEAIRASHERFLRVFNQQFQFMAILDPCGVLIEINDMPLRLSGLRRDAILGRAFWETPFLRDFPAAPAWWTTALQRAAQTDEPVLAEIQFKTTKGEIRDADLSLSAVRDAQGRAEYFLVQAIDITDRKRAEADARAREDLIRLASHTARLGGWSIDLPDYRVIWSDEVCMIHGMPVGTVPTLEDGIRFYAPEYQDMVNALLGACLNNGAPFEFEAEIISASGERVWIRVLGVAERDGSGAITRVRGSCQDISARKRSEGAVLAARAAREANRAKSAFLAMMSHEIRTPMNGVIGMVDVLYQTNMDRAQIDMLDLIRDSALALLKIIDDILDFSKIEAGKMEIEQSVMSAPEVVEKVCRMAQHMARKQSVELSFFVDPAIPATLIGDPGRLRQILVNLTSNAIKFSSGRPTPGRVSVRAELVEANAGRVTVDVRVADNGIGMDEDTLARVFTAFSQADPSTTRRFGGTGLGLAISRQLVELMGGELTVESQLNAGSAFTARLPFLAAPSADSIDPDAEAVDGLRCLIIGTPESAADDLVAYLSATGAPVERALDPAEAVLRINALAPGLWVCILDGAGDEPDAALARLREAGARPDLDLRFVALVRGACTAGDPADPALVSVRRESLTQRTLLKAIAHAAGRATGEPAAPLEAPSEPGVGTGLRPGQAPAPFPEQFPAQFPEHLPGTPPDGRIVLIAEDDPPSQRVLLKQLRVLGYAAHIASTGPEALALWRRGEYALLLTDLRMPELDGYGLTRGIRAEEREGARIPIIALTANALREEEERCLKAGMDAYLTKPLRLAELREIMQKWLPIDAGSPVALPLAPPESGASSPQEQGRASSSPLERLDLNALRAVLGDGAEVLREFLRGFQQSSSEQATDLQRACAAASVREVELIAHRLKSSARAVGAFALGEICDTLERAGRTRDAAALGGLWLQFEAEQRFVSHAIDRRLSETTQAGNR